MNLDPHFPSIVQLSDAQLRAYNVGDVEAFAACFHDDVIVLDATGAESFRGIDALRSRYRALFEGFDGVHAVIEGRLVCEPHVF